MSGRTHNSKDILKVFLFLLLFFRNTTNRSVFTVSCLFSRESKASSWDLEGDVHIKSNLAGSAEIRTPTFFSEIVVNNCILTWTEFNVTAAYFSYSRNLFL